MTGIDAIDLAANGWKVLRTPKTAGTSKPQRSSGDVVPSVVNGIPISTEARASIRPSPPIFDGIPAELKAIPHWVLWRIEVRGGKHTKVPYFIDQCETDSPRLQRASSTDPSTWTSFKNARKAFERWGEHGLVNGVGFVFTRDAGIVGVDFDHCRDLDKDEWDPEVLELVGAFDSYTEISPSGDGLHIFALGSIPGERCRRGNIEIYDHGRFFTVTGNRLDGTPEEVNEVAPGSIERLYTAIEGEMGSKTGHATWPPRSASLTDAEVIERCRRAKNHDKFERLWKGDIGGYGSASEADLALCNFLAYHSNGDFGTIDRLFRRSGLDRPKWDEWRGRLTYGDRTIQQSVSGMVPSSQVLLDVESQSNEERTRDAATLETKDFNCTDVGNGERLVYRYGENLRYCAPWKQWLLWDDRHWYPDRFGKVMVCAKATARKIFDEAATEKLDSRRTELSKWARASEGERRVRAMLSLAESDLSVAPDHLDADGNLLNLQNGTLELDTRTFREHRRDDFCTKMAGVSYDPTAKCPNWEAHLGLIFNGDRELIEGIQDLFGYSLIDGNPEQVFNVFYGHGQNGKSVLLAVLRGVLGDYAVHAAASTFMAQENDGRPRSDLLALKGARLVTAVETEDSKHLAEGLVKASTGGDPITCRGLYKEEETFLPSHVPVLATNHKPLVRGMDHAIWRRLLLWPFEVTIPEKDRVTGYEQMLMAEGSGILNWCLEGLRHYQENSARLKVPAKVRAATDQYRNDMDRLGPFLSEYLSEEPWPEQVDREIKITKKEFSDLYKLWCDQYGVRNRLSDHMIKNTLEERGIVNRRGTAGAHYWIGIRAKSPEEIKRDRDTVDTPISLDGCE